jgi:hypothetical protein
MADRSMTWKSAALITGATALVAWLAAPSTPMGPASAAGNAGTTAAPPVTSTIETEAARLSARTQPQASAPRPQRNPFEFARSREMTAVAAPRVETTPVPVLPPVPEWPAVRLTGVATDIVADTPQRTAIFSGRDGVFLVREGETVLDRYRVTRIEEEAVEITRLEDAANLRIELTPPAPAPGVPSASTPGTPSASTLGTPPASAPGAVTAQP